MQAQTGPPGPTAEEETYSARVARHPRADRGPRPKQGAHLLELRRKAGLTQTELALAIGVPQATIALWEWSSKPPRSDVLPAMAKVFGVRMDGLLLSESSAPLARRSGPVGEVQRVFEEVRSLPRKQQRKILETVTALLERYKRQAS